MSLATRGLPIDFGGWRQAVGAGVFPTERMDLEFKRQLYTTPDGPEPPDPQQRRKDHAELARDAAMLAIRGGYLIYGIAENKTNHTFRVTPIRIPEGLVDTVVQVVREWTAPHLTVLPELLLEPGRTDRGLLAVEVPESEMAPHMVDGSYFRRDATIRVRLDDAEVERLIRLRGQLDERLHQAMRETVEMEPLFVPSDRWASHLRLTAIPSQPEPDMFLRFTRGVSELESLLRLMFALPQIPPSQGGVGLAFQSRWRGGARFEERGFGTTEGSGRRLHVADGGSLRYYNLALSTDDQGRPPWSAILARAESVYDRSQSGPRLLFDEYLYAEVTWVGALLAALSKEVHYTGGWGIAVELDRLDGSASEMLHRRPAFRSSYTYAGSHYRQATRCTVEELLHTTSLVLQRLLRRLLRDLGSEQLLLTE